MILTLMGEFHRKFFFQKNQFHNTFRKNLTSIKYTFF